jgi:hypothetical protein
MKRILFVLLFSVLLFCAVIVLCAEHNAEIARKDREERNRERSQAYTQNEYWPDRSDVKKIVTFPKQKPKVETKQEKYMRTKMGIIHPPLSLIEDEPKQTSARDYRQSNQPDDFFKLN